MFATAGPYLANGLFFGTTHVVRLKLFRLKAAEEHDYRTLAEIFDFCTQLCFKMSFFLTVFSLQPIHLSSYYFLNVILHLYKGISLPPRRCLYSSSPFKKSYFLMPPLMLAFMLRTMLSKPTLTARHLWS